MATLRKLATPQGRKGLRFILLRVAMSAALWAGIIGAVLILLGIAD